MESAKGMAGRRIPRRKSANGRRNRGVQLLWRLAAAVEGERGRVVARARPSPRPSIYRGSRCVGRPMGVGRPVNV